MNRKSVLLALAALVFCALPAHAQAIVQNPTQIFFTPSTDQTTVDPVTGTPLLTNYQLNVVATNPIGAIGFGKGLGKPTPDGSNIITITIPEFLTMSAGVVYSATVSAVGPGGTNASPTSDPFGRPGTGKAPAAPGKPVAK